MVIPWLLFFLAILGIALEIPKENKYAKWIGRSLVFISAVLWLVTAYTGEAELKATQQDISQTKRFAVIATYGLYGGPVFYGPGLKGGDDLYQRLQGTYFTDEGGFKYKCGVSEVIYRQLIKDYPDFPFTYYALADCLRARGDSSWVDFAKSALAILDVTTSIGEHKPEHDVVKQTLQQYLASK